MRKTLSPVIALLATFFCTTLGVHVIRSWVVNSESELDQNSQIIHA